MTAITAPGAAGEYHPAMLSRTWRRVNLAVAVAGTLAAPAAAVQGRGAMPGLAVELGLGARRIAPGQEVVATVTLTNRGPTPLTVLVPGSLVGPQLRVTGPAGEELAFEPGPRTLLVKPGLYLGKAVRLLPGQGTRFALFLYLDERRRLYCSALAQADPIPPGEAAARGLPEGFPARHYQASHAFRLSGPGLHRLSFRVEQVEGDRSWRLAGGGPEGWASALWLGSAESSAVELALP